MRQEETIDRKARSPSKGAHWRRAQKEVRLAEGEEALCFLNIAFPQARLKAGTQRVCQNSFASATSVKLFPLPYSMLIVNAELPVPVPALLS